MSSVAAAMAKLNLARVPRSFRQALAKVCRRAGLVERGLRLLHPIVRSARPLKMTATPGEICEYAVLLSRNGSIAEALQLLGDVEDSFAPEARLYRGFCHISAWDYMAAQVHLEHFLKSPVDPYSALIARINLASCYVTTQRFDEARALLEEILSIARANQSTRLVGNALELQGQILIKANQLREARVLLGEAMDLFSREKSYDQLLTRKWLAVIDSLETNSTAPLDAFRSEAVARSHWESVREADLYRLKISFDQQRYDYLVYGTAMPAYRDRIQKEIGHQPSPTYIWGKAERGFLDLTSGELEGLHGLPPGRKIHQLFQELAIDFYVPRNMGLLFAGLYPNEHFDVFHSPTRTKQLIRRARNWLRQNRFDTRIEFHQNGYRLLFGSGFGIKLALDQPTMTVEALQKRLIECAFPPGVRFTKENAIAQLGLSRSSFHRLVQSAIEQGWLKRMGAGRASSYEVIIQNSSQTRAKAA